MHQVSLVDVGHALGMGTIDSGIKVAALAENHGPVCSSTESILL